jgi:hypothetical protein
MIWGDKENVLAMYPHPHGGINVDQHSKPRNMCKYSILYSHLFRGFEWSGPIFVDGPVIAVSGLFTHNMCIHISTYIEIDTYTYLYLHIYIHIHIY